MKLYEFTFTDKHNLCETEIRKAISGFLLDESDRQGWKLGYTLVSLGYLKQPSLNTREFLFEVHGEYVEKEDIL